MRKTFKHSLLSLNCNIFPPSPKVLAFGYIDSKPVNFFFPVPNIQSIFKVLFLSKYILPKRYWLIMSNSDKLQKVLFLKKFPTKILKVKKLSFFRYITDNAPK